MATSALIVRVPEAEATVGTLRAKFDPMSSLGVPAHITVLFPFMPPESLTSKVLDRLRDSFATVPAFSYALDSIGQFETTTYLVPTPPEPFIALTASVVGQFPQFPPYGGQHARVVPHLTVAHGEANNVAFAAIELTAKMRVRPSILSQCVEVHMIENSSGSWRDMHVFELGH